ncbi:MAG: DUF3054 domain-containing protein [Chloroflexi bacterium]|nr:DUF3054 domain-containing protein [Chloroflexota bacterium]
MSRYPLLLYVGDILTIILFTLIGRGSHSMATGLSAFLETLSTAAPFIIAWLLVAYGFGAFRPQAWADVRSAVRIVVIAYIPALIVGILLRALLLGRFSPLPFYLVTAVALLAMLLAWRLLYTLVLAPRLSH